MRLILSEILIILIMYIPWRLMHSGRPSRAGQSNRTTATRTSFGVARRVRPRRVRNAPTEDDDSSSPGCPEPSSVEECRYINSWAVVTANSDATLASVRCGGNRIHEPDTVIRDTSSPRKRKSPRRILPPPPPWNIAGNTYAFRSFRKETRGFRIDGGGGDSASAVQVR